jgi:hypothetical protein
MKLTGEEVKTVIEEYKDEIAKDVSKSPKVINQQQTALEAALYRVKMAEKEKNGDK